MTGSITARDILTQALGLIEETYWTRRAEYRFSLLDDRPEKHRTIKLDTAYARDSTHPHQRRLDDDGNYTADVVGVCSIGAVALARSLLADTPLKSFYSMVMDDEATFRAALALDNVVARRNPALISFLHSGLGSIVARWNDSYATREQVIDCFNEALQSPFLDAEKIWQIKGKVNNSYMMPSGVYYVDEDKARELVGFIMDTPKRPESPAPGEEYQYHRCTLLWDWKKAGFELIVEEYVHPTRTTVAS